MECPYCRTALAGGTAACPGCGLTADGVSALLGPVPVFEQPVGDRAAVLSPRGKRQLADRIEKIEHLFPQIRVRFVIGHFGVEHPLSLHTFWLFNSGQFCGAAEKAGHNRLILLVLDPEAQRAALTAGYGLEPFLGGPSLDELLEKPRKLWQARSWQEGLRVLADELELRLKDIARSLEDAFGIVSRAEHRPGGGF